LGLCLKFREHGENPGVNLGVSADCEFDRVIGAADPLVKAAFDLEILTRMKIFD
jgi:hypothetical protein